MHCGKMLTEDFCMVVDIVEFLGFGIGLTERALRAYHLVLKIAANIVI
jgi:hypothetical protein